MHTQYWHNSNLLSTVDRITINDFYDLKNDLRTWYVIVNDLDIIVRVTKCYHELSNFQNMHLRSVNTFDSNWYQK